MASLDPSKPDMRAARRKERGRWFVLSVSSSEASGPSGAGARGGAARNLRNDSGVKISVSKLGASRAARRA